MWDQKTESHRLDDLLALTAYQVLTGKGNPRENYELFDNIIQRLQSATPLSERLRYFLFDLIRILQTEKASRKISEKKLAKLYEHLKRAEPLPEQPRKYLSSVLQFIWRTNHKHRLKKRFNLSAPRGRSVNWQSAARYLKIATANHRDKILGIKATASVFELARTHCISERRVKKILAEADPREVLAQAALEEREALPPDEIEKIKDQWRQE